MKYIAIIFIAVASAGVATILFINLRQSDGSNGYFCNKREYKYGLVCVCNETQCGNFSQVPIPNAGFYTLISSSKEGERFNVRSNLLSINSSIEYDSIISINSSDLRQTIVGFGGSFTDSAGMGIASLSEEMQVNLLRSYFSTDGIEYNIARIPIAGTDFSTRVYSYDDIEGDTDLKNFTLAEEDHLYKIPYILQAISISDKTIHFFGSPWAPPAWMKTNGQVTGIGGLLPDMNQAWANYFVKFLDSYHTKGIDMWGLTVQNEPSMGSVLPGLWNSCGFTAEEERDFVKNYLGPTLTNATYLPDLKLMVFDENRIFMPSFPATILSDPDALQYISGVAVHWYLDSMISSKVLDDTHDSFPDKFIMYTEASAGYVPLEKDVKLGSWERAEDYASNIIEDLNHWSVGWTDWNLALDMKGGPNWAENYVDAPIIINEESNEFLKQPMFYAIGHFSKFITEDSVVLKTKVHSKGTNEVETLSVLRPDGMKVIVVLNLDASPSSVLIKDLETCILTLEVPGNSLHTIIFN